MYVRIYNQDQFINFHEVFVRNIFSNQGLGFLSPILNSVFCKTKVTNMLKCGFAEKDIVFLCPVAAFLSCQSLAVLRRFLYCKHFRGDLTCLLAELVTRWEITTHPSCSVVLFGISVMYWMYWQWLAQLDVLSFLWWHFLRQPTNSPPFATSHIRDKKLEKEKHKESFM